MKLLIDAGNTRCKWALMSDAGELQCDGILDAAQLDAARLPPAFSEADAIWMANVAGEQTLQLLQQMLEPLGLPIQQLQVSEVYQSLRNAYEPVQQLGIDRWCALIAAWQSLQTSASGTACLVINAGTALTIDAIAHNTFIGGLIVPGMRLQTQALAQLAFSQARYSTLDEHPIVSQGKLAEFPNNSIDACWSGVIQSLIGAIQRQYAYLQARTQSEIICLLSGGDAAIIAVQLAREKIPYRIEPHLVLQGIYLLGRQSKSH